MSTAAAKSPSSRPPWFRVLLILAALVVVLVLAVRFIASPIATAIANKKLAALDGFTGHVGSIKIKPWRAGMEINDFGLHERGFENDLPLLRVKKAMMSTAGPRRTLSRPR